MIHRHIKFAVPSDRVDDFRVFFETRYLPPMSEIDGFVSARLLRPTHNEDEVLMVLQFTDADASARWRESGAHERLQPDLRSLHSGMVIAGYEDL